MLKVVIISGPSGSGNTTARFVFEEIGYRVIENPTVESLDILLDSLSTEKYHCKMLCLILEMSYAKEGIKLLKGRDDIELTTIIITASLEAIMKRYALSRHAHPLAVRRKMSLNDAVETEIDLSMHCQPLADFFIDTSDLTPKELKNKLYEHLENKKMGRLTIQFTSFGVKNNIPKDLDMLLDVRVIPNPFWIDSLKDLTGLDQEVVDYIMSFDITKKYLEEVVSYIEHTLELIIESGRPYYNIGIACTGGVHRSVFVAEYLAEYFKDKYRVAVSHRDLGLREKYIEK